MNSKVQQLAAKFALNIVDFDPSQERETGWLSKLEQELQMRRRTMRTARTTLDAMLNHGQQGILIIDGQHRVTLCNKRAQQLLDLPNELLSNNPLYADLIDYQYRSGEFSCYEIPEDIRDRAAKIIDSPECYERLRPNGTMLEVRSVPTPDGGAVRTFTDVTARREQENCLRRTEAEYRSLFDNAVIGIYRSSIDGRLLRANAALVHMSGYSSEDEMIAAVNCRASEIYVEPARRNEFNAIMARQGRINDFVSEIYRYRTREKIWVSESAWLIADEAGNPAFIEGTMLDTTHRKNAEARVTYMAHHDGLTDLPNRAQFLRMLDRAAASADDQSFAILYLDIDRFKEINDGHSHSFGDEVLRAVANRLREAIGSHNSVARIGGDEFAVLMRDIRDELHLHVVTARILAEFSKPFELDNQTLHLNASVGMALGKPGTTSQFLVSQADMALFRAKAKGGRATHLFEPKMMAELQERRQLEQDMRLAITRKEFEVYFQPIVDLQNTEVKGYEALLRWNHPTRGLVQPSQFIPIAEETGMIVAIGEWVLREACRRIAQVNDDSFVAVNLSAVQFRSSNLARVITSALVAAQLPPNRLVLEVTESVLLSDDEGTHQALEELHQLGAQLSLDDFGIGYSSLRYLQKFPFDKIKIDRSFVESIESNRKNLAVVRAVISLGKDLNMSIIAEGIETDIQRAVLLSLGCTQAQGYLFGRPLPAASWIGARTIAHDAKTKEHGKTPNPSSYFQPDLAPQL